MRPVISLIAIKDDSVLLVKKRQTWILPGGKPEDGESEIACLKRELEEELPSLEVNDLDKYKDFTGIAPHRGDEIKVTTYFGKVSGSIESAAEIKDSAWINDIESLKVSDSTEKIFKDLKGRYI